MRFKGSQSYVSTEHLTLAANAAITLQRPLLVKASPAPARPCSLHGALLKNEQDVHLFERLVFMTRAKGA